MNPQVHFPKMKTRAIKEYKNAIFRYDYFLKQRGSAVPLLPSHGNLGDYIQSLAAYQFFPSKSFLTVDRDSIKKYSGEPVNLIANSWYFLSENNECFSKNINPLLLSIHIQNNRLSEESIRFFKKYEPVGCRDLATLETFRNYGIKAFFSACLTLTLGEKYTAPKNEKKDEVIFVDFDMESLPEKIRISLNNYLKNYNLQQVVSLTHTYELNNLEPMETAENLLRRYARAKLVITTRIHAALPCLAMGTTVILVKKGAKPDSRYEGLIKFVNFIGYDEYGEFIDHVLTDTNANIINDTRHIPYVVELKKTIHEFFNE